MPYVICIGWHCWQDWGRCYGCRVAMCDVSQRVCRSLPVPGMARAASWSRAWSITTQCPAAHARLYRPAATLAVVLRPLGPGDELTTGCSPAKRSPAAASQRHNGPPRTRLGRRRVSPRSTRACRVGRKPQPPDSGAVRPTIGCPPLSGGCEPYLAHRSSAGYPKTALTAPAPTPPA